MKFRFQEEQEYADGIEKLLQNPCEREKILREYQQRAMRAEQMETSLREVAERMGNDLSSLDRIADRFYRSLPQEKSFFPREGWEHYVELCTALRLMQERADAIKGNLNAFSLSDVSDPQSTEADVLFGYAEELGEEIASLANSFATELAKDREKARNVLRKALFCKDLMQNFLARELPIFFERILAASDAENGGRSFRMGEIRSLFGEFLHRSKTVKQTLDKQKTGGTVI